MECADTLEIIVQTKSLSTPRPILFEDLFDMKDELTVLLFLWNTSSYLIRTDSNSFTINGGRNMQFPHLGPSVIEYRRRTQVDVSLNNDIATPHHRISWIIGLQGVDRAMYIEIAEDGKLWKWKTSL